MYRCNVCGEGGEYETLVLDCPMFKQARIVLDQWTTTLHSPDTFAPVGLLQPITFHLEPKTDETDVWQLSAPHQPLAATANQQTALPQSSHSLALSDTSLQQSAASGTEPSSALHQAAATPTDEGLVHAAVIEVPLDFPAAVLNALDVCLLTGHSLSGEDQPTEQQLHHNDNSKSAQLQPQSEQLSINSKAFNAGAIDRTPNGPAGPASSAGGADPENSADRSCAGLAAAEPENSAGLAASEPEPSTRSDYQAEVQLQHGHDYARAVCCVSGAFNDALQGGERTAKALDAALQGIAGGMHTHSELLVTVLWLLHIL